MRIDTLKPILEKFHNDLSLKAQLGVNYNKVIDWPTESKRIYNGADISVLRPKTLFVNFENTNRLYQNILEQLNKSNDYYLNVIDIKLEWDIMPINPVSDENVYILDRIKNFDMVNVQQNVAGNDFNFNISIDSDLKLSLSTEDYGSNYINFGRIIFNLSEIPLIFKK